MLPKLIVTRRNLQQLELSYVTYLELTITLQQ